MRSRFWFDITIPGTSLEARTNLTSSWLVFEMGFPTGNCRGKFPGKYGKIPLRQIPIKFPHKFPSYFLIANIKLRHFLLKFANAVMLIL
jgi:hypothetical protein